MPNLLSPEHLNQFCATGYLGTALSADLMLLPADGGPGRAHPLWRWTRRWQRMQRWAGLASAATPGAQVKHSAFKNKRLSPAVHSILPGS